MRERGQRGNVILLMVMTLPIIMLFLSLGVDVSHAHSLGVMNKQSLDDACQEVQMRQDEVKFSDAPDRTVRDLVRDALERDGFVGRARVRYLERADRRTPGGSEDDERHIVVEVAVARGAGSAFGLGRVWPVTDQVVWTMRAYASYRVWRPDVVPQADGATYGRWHEMVFEATDGARSVGTDVSSGSLGIEGLSPEGRSELERVGDEG